MTAPPLTSALQRAPVLTACVLIALGYGVVIALASPAAFPERLATDSALPYLSDKPVGEDGFYMLTVAWHLAEGRGLVYNHDLPTTGIQPLATFLYAGAAWFVQALGGDRWMLLRIVQLLGLLNLVALAALLGHIARSAFDDREAGRTAFVVAVSLTAFNFWLYRALTYGLETGLYLLLLAACVALTIRLLPRLTWRGALALGLLAGLAGLARIDFGVVLFGFLSAGVLSRRIRLGHGLVVGATALALVLPWLAWVRHVTGSWIPSSGAAQSSLIAPFNARIRVQEGAEAFLNHLTPWIFTGSRLDLGAVALASVIALVVLFRLRRPAPLQTPAGWRSALVLWTAGIALLCGTYVALFGVVHFYERYLSPVLLVIIPVLAMSTARRIPAAARPRWQAAAPVAMLACFAVWAMVSFHRGRVGNTHAVTAGFVQARFPPPQRVGAFQSGAIGYFNPNVVNLDGKLNQAALEARRVGRLGDYVDSAGIEVLVDWPRHIFYSFSQPYLEAWSACDERPDNGLTVCILRPSDR